MAAGGLVAEEGLAVVDSVAADWVAADWEAAGLVEADWEAVAEEEEVAD